MTDLAGAAPGDTDDSRKLVVGTAHNLLDYMNL